MNKLDIFCFTSIARTRSFSLTARELHISQQAVSKHIRSLETELGYPLFFRSTMELTQAGSYMLDYFSKREELLKEIRKNCAAHVSARSLRIGCSQWLGSPSWFEEAIRSFQKETDGLEIHLQDLDAQEAAQAIRTESIDLFLTTRYMAHRISSFWKCVPLCTQPLYLIGNHTCEFVPEKLAFLPFYAADAGEETENALRIQTVKTCGKLGFLPHQIHRCHDMGTVMLNILLNDGVTLGTTPPARNTINHYKFLKTDLTCEIVLALPWLSDNPLIEKVVGFTLEHLASSPEDKESYE